MAGSSSRRSSAASVLIDQSIGDRRPPPVAALGATMRENVATSRHVFISYHHDDRPYVRRLAALLLRSGLTTWYDRAVEPGDRLASKIQAAIDDCAAAVVVMTPASVASEWVGREITYCISQRKLLVPLMLRPCSPLLELAGLLHEDVTRGQLPSLRFIDRLRAAVVAT